MAIRVVIIEDHDPTRRSLAALLRGSPGFEVAGDYARAETALRHLPVDRPEVILLDLELPRMRGVDFLRRIRAERCKAEALVLTVHDSPDWIFEALAAGATGYLVKPVAPVRILEAIQELHAGGSPMSGAIARLVLRRVQRETEQRQKIGQLTGREMEILNLLAQGCRHQDIADRLSISHRTVSTHLHHIYEKLQVHSAVEAASRYWKREPEAGANPPG